MNTKILKSILLVSSLLLLTQKGFATDTNGYYWYKANVSAYPSGKGQIYATEHTDEMPNDDKFTDEMSLNVVTRYPGEAFGDNIFYAIAKPNPDYNFVGWYSAGEDMQPDSINKYHFEAWKHIYGERMYKDFFIDSCGGRDAFDGIYELEYYYSEENDYDSAYFDYAPMNRIYGVFGKVNIDYLIDDYYNLYLQPDKEDSIVKFKITEDDAYSIFVKYSSMQWLTNYPQLNLSKPANDIGDSLILKACWKNKAGDDDYRFKYWTDSNGNKYYGQELRVKVTEKDTYIAHFDIYIKHADKHLVTFIDYDNIIIRQDSMRYKAEIIPPEPWREGYTFTGWSPEVDSLVPAHDVTYMATYSVNTYSVTYYVGTETVHVDSVCYGYPIPEYIYKPTDERHTFHGWEGETYETMPAYDISYSAIIYDGIDYICRDDSKFDVYTISGILIGRNLDAADLRKKLTPGLYIINNKKVLVN